MALGFGSLISPKAGMGIVKAAIEKTIKQDMNNFDVIYRHKDKVIDFRLYNYTDDKKVFHESLIVKYSDGKKLCGIIEKMINENLKTKDEINFAVINYARMDCNLYIIRDGEKKQLTYKL